MVPSRWLQVSLLALASGCAASRSLAPLEAGQHGVTVSLGGPFVEFGGAPVPVPFTAVGWRYGVDGKTDIHAALYPTGPILIGVFGWDVGMSTMLLDADGGRPRVMFATTSHWLVGDNGPGGDPAAFRLFLSPSFVFTWDLGPQKHRVYAGAEAFLQPLPQPRALPTLMLGTELQANERVGVQIELGWHGFHRNTEVGVPVWIGPGDQGAISAKVGINVRLPRKGEGRRARKQAEADAAQEEVSP